MLRSHGRADSWTVVTVHFDGDQQGALEGRARRGVIWICERAERRDELYVFKTNNRQA